MAEIRTAHLMTLTLAVSGMQAIGATPNGNRRIGLVAGGTFQWRAAARHGAAWRSGLDYGACRRCHHAGCAAGVGDRGQGADRHDVSRHAPWPRGGDGAAQPRRAVDASEYYFRTSVAFETAATKYDWLNRIIAVGTGRRPPEGPCTTSSRCCEMATIGFIGLGNMGAPMAANLVKAGHSVVGYDINAGTVQALVAGGGKAAGSAAEAAGGADVVITMLPAGEHVREVWLHQGGLIEAVKGRYAAADRLLHDRCGERACSERGSTCRRVRDARCTGVRRCRRRLGGHADLHGRWQ